MIKRIKQFYMAIICKVSEEDKSFIKTYLNKKEREMFYKLSISEQCHCIRVARDIEKLLKKEKYKSKIKISKNELVKVGLLHDIGKITCNVNIIEKSILVLLNALTKGNLKKIKGSNKVNVYYNHGIIGASILNKMQYSERFLYLVKNHHNNDIIGDVELHIIKKCDDRN